MSSVPDTPGEGLPPQQMVFDLGNVLVRWDPEALCREQFPGDEARAQEICEGIFLHNDWQMLDEGLLEEEEANQRFSERVQLDLPTLRSLMLACKVSLVPIPETVALLNELHRRRVPLYALTNMARGTFEFLRPRYPWFEHFRGIVVSAYLKRIKPHPGIYEHLLQTYRLDPARTVFTDDSQPNVDAARALGIQAHHFTTADALRPHLHWL